MKETTLHFDVPEECREFAEAIWNDFCNNARALGIRGFTLKVIAFDLSSIPRNTVATFCLERQIAPWWFMKNCWTENNALLLRQAYDAELHMADNSRNYRRGSIHIETRAFRKKDTKKMMHFLDLNFVSYYRRIAEFFPDFTTRYIDAPKEVK